MPFLMLGEALVDLIAEQAAEGIGDAGSFTPHFGGAAANVVVSAARAGGRPAPGGRAGEAVEATEALVFASNTLVGPEREVMLRARERALELGRPVCFDPNLRLERWPSPEEAVAGARGCLEAACS